MTTPKLGMPFEAQFSRERAQEWVIQRLIRQIHTATLVKVAAVYPTADTVGFVDVTPLVQQQQTDGTLLPTARMFRLPYLRVQGGVSAIILDPAVGDLGVAVFAERDITTVIATRAEAAAATNRAFDAGDGLYLGGMLNADPTQYVEFLPQATGINIVTPGDLLLHADGNMAIEVGGNLSIEVGADVTVSAASTTWSGPVTFNDPITAPEATIDGIAFTTHKHISAGSGSPTGTPIP